MAVPRGYRSFADFEREELRPHMRIGWSVDELELSERELDFADPFEAMWDAAEAEGYEDDD